MIKYDKYKPSGIEWLGDIPEHWDVKRVKDLGEYQSGEYINALDFLDEGYPVYGGNGFRGYAAEYNHNGSYILIGRQGALCGNINYAEGKFWATEHAIVVYKKSQIDSIWLGELLRIMNLNQYSLSAAQPGLSVEKIKRLELPYVSSKEQIDIANFITKQTSAIDRKIALLKQKITHYQQLRKSLINETVCRGLNKNVKLKDSEIEWIGKIPEHWEVKRLKDVCGYINRGLSPIYVETGSYKVVNQATFSKGFWDETNLKYTQISDIKARGLLKEDDILIASTGGGVLGKVYFFKKKESNYIADSHITILRDNGESYFPKYVYYSFSEKYKLINDILAQGSTNQIELQKDLLIAFYISIPPLSEQIQIAQYLDEKTQMIDNILTNIKSQVETLKELRKTLINDVVTGKIKVTEN